MTIVMIICMMTAIAVAMWKRGTVSADAGGDDAGTCGDGGDGGGGGD